jgi:translation elongation factor EF-Ts
MIDACRTIHAYVHQGRIGVLVELATQSDFTTRIDEFIELRNDLAMHIAASAPQDLAALLAQPFVKDRELTVARHIAEVSARLAECIAITRFVRWDQTLAPIEPSPEPPKRPAVILHGTFGRPI